MSDGKRDNLEKHGLLLLVTAQVANVCGLLFHMAMGGDRFSWSLEETEYQILVFMLNTILIFVVPLDALRTMVGHYSALMAQEDRLGDVQRFARYWGRRLMACGLVVGVVGSIFSPMIVSAFNMDRPFTFSLTMWTLAITFLMPMYAGLLQGIQAFVWMSVVYNIWSLIRFVLGVLLLVFVVDRAVVGIWGQFAGIVVTIALGWYGLRQVCAGRESTGAPLPKAAGYLFKSMFILTGFGVLFNADIHLVQYFLPETGDMAAKAGTIARAVVFLPMPIALAMFPKVSSSGTLTKADVLTLAKALLYVGILLAGIAGVCAVKPNWPLWVLYGEQNPSPELLATVRAYVIGMSPLSLTYLLMNFNLAQRRFVPCYTIIVGAILYIVGAVYSHTQIIDIIHTLALTATVVCVFLLGNIFWSAKKGAQVSRASV